MSRSRRWRRLAMGLAKLLGRPRGFFSPYRYAESVVLPAGYPAPEWARAGLCGVRHGQVGGAAPY
ncbi:MAG: hypothetical protein AAF698_06175 [Pseudomonadota bacterium]